MHREYNIVIKNSSSRTISKANVAYNGFNSGGGIIDPGYRATYISPGLKLPLTAVVSWRLENGIDYSEVVDVKRNIPRNFSGDVYFEITDDNHVSVRPVRDTY